MERTLGSPKRLITAARIVAGIVERATTGRAPERREVFVDGMSVRRRRFRSEDTSTDARAAPFVSHDRRPYISESSGLRSREIAAPIDDVMELESR